MLMQDALAVVTQGGHLSRGEAAEVMTAIMSGNATHAQMGALLAALRLRGETVDEITGMAETMRRFAVKVSPTRRPLLDTCGTGGDHSGTFNISTTAAFVAAGAGVAVAKHGNRSASSRCGSADVLEALGVAIDLPPEAVAACIDEIGVGFLFARALHGAMKHVAPVRQELRVRTVFNLLGPLTNPAEADAQMMGVFDPVHVEPVAHVMRGLGVRHAFVVSGLDGLDEISLSGPSRVAELKHGKVVVFEVSPEDFGFARVDRAFLHGGDPAENAGILRAILSGERGPRRDAVVLNTAPGLVAAGIAEDIPQGIVRAAESLDSGAALAKLEALIRLTNDGRWR